MEIGLYILLLILSVVYFILWTWTYVHAFRRGKIWWGIFIVTFNVVLIIYWIYYATNEKLRKKEKYF